MQKRSRGFSLLELVIVVSIIGIIAAIAIPRFSRATAGAADAALTGDLAVMRNAIDMFAAEHGGTFPALATIVAQLTTYTDVAGTANASKTTTYIYGPYLRQVPKLPVGAKKGQTGIDDEAGAAIGWIYTAATGDIKAATTDLELDAAGTKYNEY
jgi:prepilin-type N-terminal cleavage/methylation domain-containing protein